MFYEIGRRKKVLSKNLRVFLLSVLVVLLAMSSAMATDESKAIKFTWKNNSNTTAEWASAANWEPSIPYDTAIGMYSFDAQVQANTYYPGGIVFVKEDKVKKANIFAEIHKNTNAISLVQLLVLSIPSMYLIQKIPLLVVLPVQLP